VALRAVTTGLRSAERNVELALLTASAAFVILAWRALDAAAIAMPAGSHRILTQFLVVALAGHAGLRAVAPQSSRALYAIVMLLVAIGLAFVTRLAPDVAGNQANWIALGVGLMVATAWAARRYAVLRRYRYTAALLAVLLLFGTGVFGTTINGARLWVTVAGQTVQTTELIKLLLVVFLAGYLADEASVLAAPRIRFGGRSYSALPYLIPLAITWLVALAALALLRDLGTIALLILLAVAALYVATGRVRFVAGGVVLLAATGAFGYVAFDHARTRIDVWLDPYSQAESAGYQTLQATYAIEAGGVTGEGLGLGQPEVIPAAPTDYVFSAIAEELGLAGALGVVLLYVLLLFGGSRVAISAPDDHGRLLAAIISLLIAIQAAVIIAGNLRLIPTTGITLPFVSYGGSSIVVNFVLVGLLLGISDAAERRPEAWPKVRERSGERPSRA
jgi:peptidoglycan glycosyltransferase